MSEPTNYAEGCHGTCYAAVEEIGRLRAELAVALEALWPLTIIACHRKTDIHNPYPPKEDCGECPTCRARRVLETASQQTP